LSASTRIVAVAGEALFVPDAAGWAKAFKSEHGLVGSAIWDITLDVAAAVQAQAPGPGKPPMNRTGINYGKGTTESTIGQKVIADGVSDVEGRVWAMPHYVKFVIHGTAPHLILPKNPGGLLRFFWVRKGKHMALPHVNHPGTMANDFLTRGLRLGFTLGA
jgi:hypothetical protein